MLVELSGETGNVPDVFWLRYSLNSFSKRGRSSSATRRYSSRYSPAEASDTSKSTVSCGYRDRKSDMAPTERWPTTFWRCTVLIRVAIQHGAGVLLDRHQA